MHEQMSFMGNRKTGKASLCVYRRSGWLLAESLLALLFLSLLAAAVLPLAGNAYRVLRDAALRGHISESVLTCTQYITEAVRSGRRRTVKAGAGDQYKFYDISTYGDDRAYTFQLSGSSLKILLYTGSVQPLTGGETGMDVLKFRREGSHLFTWDETGLLRFSFSVESEETGLKKVGLSSVLPYADYYRKGDFYES